MVRRKYIFLPNFLPISVRRREGMTGEEEEGGEERDGGEWKGGEGGEEGESGELFTEGDAPDHAHRHGASVVEASGFPARHLGQNAHRLTVEGLLHALDYLYMAD